MPLYGIIFIMSEYLLQNGLSVNEKSLSLEKDDRSLERTLLRDFYASFRFSQGSGPAHDEFFRGIRITYEMRLGEASYSQFQDRLEALDVFDADKLRVPFNHANSRGLKGPQNEFKNRLYGFLTVLKGPPVGDYTDILRRIGAHTVDRDVRYQDAKRYHSPEDVHKSYFREYILGLEPTGNESFDYLFGLVAATFDSEWLARSGIVELDDLVDGWHASHPNDVFITG